LPQLAPNNAVALSKFIVSADAGKGATIARRSKIDRPRTMVSSHTMCSSTVKASIWPPLKP
jgi:hypothetical protein